MNGFGVLLLLFGVVILAFVLTPRGRDTFQVAAGMKRAV